MSKPNREVAEKKDGALAVIDYAADAGAGVQGMTAADVALPFIVVLQKGSPQVDVDHANHAEYADGNYAVGDFFDTVSRDAYKELAVIDCGYVSCYVEWKPRESGGGYVTQHSVAAGTELLAKCKRNDKNQDVLPNGNLLVNTHYHYCMVDGGKGFSQAVISMTSTQLKKSRRLNSLLMKSTVPSPNGPVQAPRFANLWKFTTVPEKNDRGTWRGINIEPMGLVTDPMLYARAREFNKLIDSGAIRVTPPSQEQEAATAAADVPY